MNRRKYSLYEIEFNNGEVPIEDTVAQRNSLEGKIDAKLKQIEGKEYRRKKRKLDEIKSLEEE